MLEYMRDCSCELPTGYKPTTYASTTGCGRAASIWCSRGVKMRHASTSSACVVARLAPSVSGLTHLVEALAAPPWTYP